MRKLLLVIACVLALIAIGILIWCFTKPRPGHVLDEAARMNRSAESFPAADEDYFAEMDYGVTKNPELVRTRLDPYVPHISAEEPRLRAVKGRNNWIVWTGGNDLFWNKLTQTTVGTIDLLKTISNGVTIGYGKETFTYGRENRWKWLGVVNEPCYRATMGRADRWGLRLDERVGCGPDPFENETKYPGVKIGERGKSIPVGSFYGYGTGVIGLRLFPNPDFDEKAQKHWNADKYYNDERYYNDKNLVKPYRVGMSCAFCHVGPNPSIPPTDFEHPEWKNLNSNPGAQYFWVDRIFVWNPQQKSFVYQLFHTSRPGALDTSFVSSDQINNPRTMNAIYNVGPRLDVASHWGEEELAGDELHNKQFNDFGLPKESPLLKFYDPATHKVWNPRVLKDGSDSVGMLGALNRVYINIGLFSEEWMLHFIPLLGGANITPIPIANAERNSSYWKATEAQTPDLAFFFLATARPDYLVAAPEHEKYMKTDVAQLNRGKQVFGERCLRCHSSKLPARAYKDYFRPGCNGPGYLKCWDDYWKWTKTLEFKQEANHIVMDPNFLDDNALTSDLRVPVTLLETNACSPLATNALAGDIWDNFASQSYKNLPPVGKVMIHHPYSGEPSWYEMPGGGRGYTRPPSLASLWSTAPFLVNNSLGNFDGRGSVEGRMASFNDSIVKLLWPEKREGKQSFKTLSGKMVPGVIDRTPEMTYLMVQKGFLPPELAGLSGSLSRFLPHTFTEAGDVALGPIPSGTPISLLSNIDLKKTKELLKLLPPIVHDIHSLPKNATDDEARKQFTPLLPKLLALSKCPDFVVNRGHYFGTDYFPEEPALSNDDKLALIEFLKTF
jgi:hypothetical protein